MKKEKTFFLFLSFCLITFLSISQPVKIIFDTDMESDVDDVGALAMLHSLAYNGEAEILGTMVCSLNPWSVPTVDAINTYFGNGDIPIGTVKTLGVYRSSIYAKMLSENYSQDIGIGENAPDAISLYRQLLTNQPDNSVVIVSVGYLTNLYNLLKSGPDEINDLTGLDLIRKKVKHFVCMGGRYPYSQDPGKWGNFKPDPGAIKYVAENWPGVITFTGGGDFSNSIKTGHQAVNYKGSKNPVSQAYQTFLKGWDRDWHHSADLIAVYIAVMGYEKFFKMNTQGYNHIFEDGTLMWRLQPNDTRHQYVDYLNESTSPTHVAKVFDELMMQLVK